MSLIQINKGQSNLAKGDIARLIYERNLDDVFYHIRQVAACVSKLVLMGAFGIPIFGEGMS